RNHHDDRMQRLTARERTVLAAVAEGKSNQAIAALLHLSAASVEKHITAIFQKLELEADGTGNRRVLAALAHIENQGPQSGPQSSQEHPRVSTTPLRPRATPRCILPNPHAPRLPDRS